jgi:hypothetical protein
MEIITLILLALVAALLWRISNSIKFGLKFFTASSDDWVVLKSYKIRDAGTAKAGWDANAPIQIEFVPIIGWTYDHGGYKYGKPTPITPPAYHVRERLNVSPADSKSQYHTLSYWIRNGVVFYISDEWDSGNLWEDLLDYAIAGRIIEVHGSVPNSCRKELSEIMAISEQHQRQKDTDTSQSNQSEYDKERTSA